MPPSPDSQFFHPWRPESDRDSSAAERPQLLGFSTERDDLVGDEPGDDGDRICGQRHVHRLRLHPPRLRPHPAPKLSEIVPHRLPLRSQRPGAGAARAGAQRGGDLPDEKVWGAVELSPARYTGFVLVLPWLWRLLCITFRRCTICLAEYREKDVLRVLPYCGHAFHNDCIGIWLRQHSTCPVCRILLRESPDRKCMMQPVYSSAIRSLYPPQMGLDAYRSLHARDAYLVRATDQRRESIHENQFISEPSGSREMVSTDITCYAKNSSPHASEVKYMESPSNA